MKKLLLLLLLINASPGLAMEPNLKSAQEVNIPIDLQPQGLVKAENTGTLKTNKRVKRLIQHCTSHRAAYGTVWGCVAIFSIVATIALIIEYTT